MGRPARQVRVQQVREYSWGVASGNVDPCLVTGWVATTPHGLWKNSTPTRQPNVIRLPQQYTKPLCRALHWSVCHNFISLNFLHQVSLMLAFAHQKQQVNTADWAALPDLAEKHHTSTLANQSAVFAYYYSTKTVQAPPFLVDWPISSIRVPFYASYTWWK